MLKRFEYLQQLLSESPNDAFLHFAMAKELEKQGNKDEALNYYLKLKTLDPNYVGLYYHLGKLYESLTREEMAIQTYKQGILVSKNAGDQHAAGELAAALLNLDDPDD